MAPKEAPLCGYQCGDALDAVGPYFQYTMPDGSAVGYVMVMVMVLPGVHPLAVKSNRPCGNTTPLGALLAGAPLNAMNWAEVNEHALPPPVKLAVIVPGPVGDGPVNVVITGVTLTAADAGPVPAALVAVTEHRYAVPFVRPVTVSGDAAPVAVNGPGVQVTV